MEFDLQLFLWINSTLTHPVLDGVAIVLSAIGAWPVGVAGFVLVLGCAPKDCCKGLALRYVIGILLVHFATLGLKHGVDAQRPAWRLEEEVASGELEVRFLFDPMPMKRSFPSGHTALAFFAMGTVALTRREWGVPALLIALGVGWSRIYSGCHFPIDCVVGALLGSALVWVIGWRAQWASQSAPR